jgi:hypothetical protein
VIAAGNALVSSFLTDHPSQAEVYRQLAYEGRSVNAENVDNFKRIIETAYGSGAYRNFNANDFANVHHVAWILIGRALASLTDHNPHGDWGDPPANGSIHFDRPQLIEFYHHVPNATGYYANGTTDRGLGAPNLGV